MKLFASDCCPDVIAITETWTHDGISNNYLKIPNYSIAARHDRNDTHNGRGGGLLVYVNEKLQSVETTRQHDFNQHCSLQIASPSSSLHLYVVYRSPNSNAVNNENLLDVLRGVNNPAIVVGDFNYPSANWGTLTGCADSRVLIDTSLDKFWTQYVDFPTHQNGNILDLVFAEDGLINEVREESPLATSDHSMLMIETNFVLKANVIGAPRFNHKKADFKKLCTMFKEVRWHEELQNKDMNECWAKFKEIYTEVVKCCIPLSNGKRKNKRPPWMNKKLLKLIRQKRKQWGVYKSNPTPESLNEFKNLRKRLKKQILKSKLNYEKEIAKNAKVNPKAFYSYIGGKRSNRTGVGPLQDANGNIITDDRLQAQMLNDFYASVFEQERAESPHIDQWDGPTIQSVAITESIVKEKLKNLKRFSSPGPDGIENIVLLEACEELSVPLMILFKKSLQTSVVPHDWRIANVTPVHKGGNKKLVNNYRPISLTSTVSKILESIIRSNVMSHLLSNDLILSSQHGFMTKKSCLTNLLHCMEEVTTILDEGHSVDILYLDFAKAFDKVQHQRLLAKMKSLGIEGSLLSWIKSWLSDREQRVVLNGQQSEIIAVPCSVPQGSVLGPILFIIFINDIDTCIKNLVALLLKFADDTKVIKRIQNYEDKQKLQSAIDNLHLWAEKWQMYFNVDKCKIIHIGRQNPRFSYTMNDKLICRYKHQTQRGILVLSLMKRLNQACSARKLQKKEIRF